MKRILLPLLLLTFPVAAFAQNSMLDLTGRVVWADPQGKNDFEDDQSNFDLDSSEGYGAALNIHWGERISTEVGAYSVDSDATLDTPVTGVNLGSLEMIPLTATLQYHLMGASRIDPYIGGGVAYVLFDELSSNDLRELDIEAIDFEDDFGYLANAGLSLGLTSNIALNVDAKWISVSSATIARPVGGVDDVEGDKVEIDIDPLLISAGVTLRF